jgi:hypothetical protein
MSDDDEIIKIFTVAHVPRTLGQLWLQHLRDFDVAHPPCRFEVMADAPGIPLTTMFEMIKLDPALTFTEIIDRTKAAPDDKPVVHILRHGLPLCRFMPLAPVHWPRNHAWVGLDERDDANCPACLKAADDQTEKRA